MKIQHGDVILEYCHKLPKGAKKQTIEDFFILERGEGVHTHVIKDTKKLNVFLDGATLWLKVDAPTEVDHEEHGPKVLPVGICKKIIENEWDQEANEARKTQD